MVVVDSKPELIRGSMDPLNQVASSFSEPTAQGNAELRFYVAWQVEHDKIVAALGKSRLGCYEAHHQTIAHLRELAKFHITLQRELPKYIQEYDFLLKQHDRGISTRMLERKYKSLKQQIQDKCKVS